MPTAKKPRVSARGRFQRSIQVEFDSASGEVGADYVVTACARRTLERILTGATRGPANRAWTITGPYGTGKSSFALFLASVLCGSTMALHNSMIAALRGSAPDLADDSRRTTLAGGCSLGRVNPSSAPPSR
jgi:hypothetical protein